MARFIPQFNPGRLRSQFNRIPLCTRCLIAVIILVFFLSIPFPVLVTAGILQPSEISISSLQRLSTFPFVHLSIFHLIFNLIALVPLLERFESENGTLVTLLLFVGPFATAPGAIYTLLSIPFGFLRARPVAGASIWVFLLLACEAVKTYKANPYFNVGGTNIPTWTTPLFLVFTIAVLIPGTSLVGHLCGLVIGYGWGFGWLRFLVPPERILRYIEGRLNLLGRLPHYVSVDQKIYGRYGVLDSEVGAGSSGNAMPAAAFRGAGQRLSGGNHSLDN